MPKVSLQDIASNPAILAANPELLQDPNILNAIQVFLDQQFGPRCFYFFVMRAWKATFGHDFVDGIHIRALCHHLQALWEGQITTLVANLPPGLGKALDIDTPVMTTWGWKKHGDLRAGDFVFGPDGQPKRVIAVTDHFSEESYDVRFADGASIIAGQNHLWQVERDCVETIPKYRRYRETTVVKTTELIASGYKRPKCEQRPDAIPICEPLQFPPRRLLIDPYLLGAWLGDGASASGSVYVADQDIEEMRHLGRLASTRPAGGTYNQDFHRLAIEGLSMRLRVLNLFRNKHIPQDYLEASIDQRWALLQGLMDTDGTCSKTSRSGRSGGSCSFTNKNTALSQQCFDLVLSLGIKAHISSKTLTRDGRKFGPYFTTVFTPQVGDKVFNLTRKQALVNCNQNPRSRMRYVESVNPVGVKTVNCIQVEGDLYLAGRHLVTTHNSSISCVLYPAWIWLNEPSAGLWFSSFGQDTLDRDSLAMRRLIDSQWWQERFSGVFHLLDDQNQKRRYDNNKGGWRLAASIEARRGFGEHPSLVLCDDPHDPEQAVSETERQMAIDYWTNKIVTRGWVRGVKRAVVAQRLNEGDLSAYVLANTPGVCHVMMPMEFEIARKCRTNIVWNLFDMTTVEGGDWSTVNGWEDPRTEEGQLLWPEGANREKVDALKANMRRAHAIAGQLQQRPTSPDGDMFVAGWFEDITIKEAPRHLPTVRAWDLASSTSARADFTAGALAAYDGDILYLIHACWGKYPREKRNDEIRKVAHDDAERYSDYHLRFEYEGGSGGKDAPEMLAEALSDEFRCYIDKAPGKPDANDSTLKGWETLADLLSRGRVRMVQGAWIEKFVQEALGAPNATHDDVLDSFAHAAHALYQRDKRATIKRPLLLVTPEEEEMLAAADAGEKPRTYRDELSDIFDDACSQGDELTLGVRW